MTRQRKTNRKSAPRRKSKPGEGILQKALEADKAAAECYEWNGSYNEKSGTPAYAGMSMLWRVYHHHHPDTNTPEFRARYRIKQQCGNHKCCRYGHLEVEMKGGPLGRYLPNDEFTRAASNWLLGHGRAEVAQ